MGMKLIITIVALVIALLVAFAVSGVLTEEKKAEPVKVRPTQTVQTKEPETDIYIASRDIAIGQEITSSDFETAKWPSRRVLGGFLTADQGSDALLGFTTSAPIVKGEPIFTSKLRNPNDPSFLSGQLGENMRAITISVNLIDSVAGFVAPGDAVDVLFTFDIDKTALDTGDITATGGEEENRIAISEVLLANVKILAVDRRVTNSNADGSIPPAPSSVTVAVNQRDAQKLKVAENVGRLSLALRSLADAGKTDIPRPSAESDTTRLLPPAYFPALFDSDAPYDYNVIDLYGRDSGASAAPADEDATIGQPKESEFMNVEIYRGVDLQSVEVNRQ